MEKFDLVVIGAGPGGYVAAIRAAQLGLKVACVEKEKTPGGTCLRVGCIPSKALLESSYHYVQAKSSFKKHGVLIDHVGLDLAAMQKRKSQVVSMLTKGVESLFRKNEVTHFTGTAKISSPTSVELATDEGPKTLQAASILIATGSRPTPIPSLPVDGTRVITSTEALDLQHVPQSLVVVGGGYIGLELGSVWARLGSRVTIVEACPQILPAMDADLATEAKRLFSKQGLKFKTGVQVTRLQTDADHCEIVLGSDETLEASKVLVAVGRIPNTQELGLESLGIETDSRGTIKIRDGFETSVPGIYAVGDVVSGPMLAHKAEEEGVAFAENLVNGSGHVNYDTIPGVVYTHPEIATVGKTEQALIDDGQAYHKAGFPFRANGRARALDQTDGFAKLLTDRPGGKILGAHLIGAQAGELINEIALAMNAEQSAEQLASSCHAHPTLGEIVKEVALAASEKGLHS